MAQTKTINKPFYNYTHIQAWPQYLDASHYRIRWNLNNNCLWQQINKHVLLTFAVCAVPSTLPSYLVYWVSLPSTQQNTHSESISSSIILQKCVSARRLQSLLKVILMTVRYGTKWIHIWYLRPKSVLEMVVGHASETLLPSPMSWRRDA